MAGFPRTIHRAGTSPATTLCAYVMNSEPQFTPFVPYNFVTSIASLTRGMSQCCRSIAHQLFARFTNCH